MTPQEWARVKQIVADALERLEPERAAFLDQACGPDTRLRAEVDRLLAAEESKSLESPVAGALGPAPELVPGHVLGHFRIESRLGHGGMGAVYRARDEKLQRTVAIKVLAEGRFGDQASRQRFLREARAASALNHPGIVTIYEAGTEDGIDFIAMELVEGESLDRRIPKKGLPLQQAMDYAVQIAGALAKAHAAGIILRDLKPSNIMVTPEGRVKLLDFGLARHVHAGEESGSTLTQAGGIVGTPAYMSPEQAEGKPLDPRSDIFSFGAVLYELLSGRRAFRGSSLPAVLGSVLKDDPAAIKGITGELWVLLQRCLRKDPARRLQHMDDVLLLLGEISEAASAPAAPEDQRRRLLLRRAALAAALFCVGAALWFAARKLPPRIAEMRIVPLTKLTGAETQPSLSGWQPGRLLLEREAGGQLRHLRLPRRLAC